MTNASQSYAFLFYYFPLHESVEDVHRDYRLVDKNLVDSSWLHRNFNYFSDIYCT